MREGTIVPSSNRGRYAVDNPDEGLELTSGQVCELFLHGQWTEGRIEHPGKLYADGDTVRAESEYAFIATNGEVCGLDAGMKIRLPD